MEIQLVDWPSWIMATVTVGAIVWGAAMFAVQVRATAIIVKSMQPRLEHLEDWKKHHDLRAEVRREIEEEMASKALIQMRGQ